MPVNYKIYKAKRTDKFNGKWYARASHTNTIDTQGLAEIMQSNCTLKRSDIVAVITELVEVMSTQLQNSMKVKLDGFGTFKIGIKSTPADTAKDFSASTNIQGLHVLFAPELKRNADGTSRRTFLNNVRLQEETEYSVDKTEA